MKQLFVYLIIGIVCFAYVSAQELQKYERKTLFLFPVQYAAAAADDVNDFRQQWAERQLYQMFVRDFKRIDFYDVQGGTLEEFLNNADAFIKANAQQIAASRMEVDGRFKEALVTLDDLLRNIEHSYALVPVVDAIKETQKTDKNGRTMIVYDMKMHFDVYSTAKKEKIYTFTGDTDVLFSSLGKTGTVIKDIGSLFMPETTKGLEDLSNSLSATFSSFASLAGKYKLDLTDLGSMSKEDRERESSYRVSFAGLYYGIKNDLQKVPEFSFASIVTTVADGRFGFDAGKDIGIKIDDRFKTYVYTETGDLKFKSFGKVRRVGEQESLSQILIGEPEEGDQVKEDPAWGLNIAAGLMLRTLRFDYEEIGLDYAETVTVFWAHMEYDLGPILTIPELYINTKVLINDGGTEFWAGLQKKWYFSRLAVSIGGSYAITDDLIIVNGGLEYLVSSRVSLIGKYNRIIDYGYTSYAFDIGMGVTL